MGKLLSRRGIVTGPQRIDDEINTPSPHYAPHLRQAILSRHLLLLDHYATFLSPEERARAERLILPSKRSAYTLTHGILHVLLGQFLNQNPRDVVIRYDDGGVPCVEGRKEEIRFSLSQSGDEALFSITRGVNSGVDIQEWGAVRNTARFARRYYTRAEQDRLTEAAPERREALFYRIWARKEACTKAIGRGLAVPFDGFEVHPDDPAPQILLRPQDGAETEVFVRDLPVDPGYSAAAAFIAEKPARLILKTFEPEKTK